MGLDGDGELDIWQVRKSLEPRQHLYILASASGCFIWLLENIFLKAQQWVIMTIRFVGISNSLNKGRDVEPQKFSVGRSQSLDVTTAMLSSHWVKHWD